uniref:CCD97-like C-terminal domain-containing protein n=1 Tax=Lutzomyia longipalpis TaxID=7200 RepID=A0A1B0GIY0_LUTLO
MATLNTEYMDDLRLKIIQNICTNDKVFFKSQQIDDPDLTADEKKEIVLDLFNKKDSIFLSRFGSYINNEYLIYFELKKYTGDEEYIIRQHLEKLKRWHKNRKVEIKNRRYAAMQKMISDSTYFTETEMMSRQPLLYDQLVGQYLSEEEKKSRDTRDNSTLLNVLLNGMDDEAYNEKLADERKFQDENSSSNSSDASFSVERIQGQEFCGGVSRHEKQFFINMHK